MNNYEFGDKIRELRKKHNLTQEELALKLNISDKSVSKWEMGTSKPTIENLQIIADIFDITLDELLRNKEARKAKIIKKIVLTGGPCAGKTTAMNWIQNHFQKQGYKVLFVPEAATNLITGGINRLEVSSDYYFQESIIDIQLNLEKTYEQIASHLNWDKILIVCDRGILDNKAYMTKRDFNFLLKSKDLTTSLIMDRYGAVFHLVTSAKGAKEYYNLDNPARKETIEEAIRIDDLLINSWTGHPHLRIIDNSSNFENKMKRLIEEIAFFLKEPEPYEIERKFLIAMPDVNYLENLENCKKVRIVQTYLNSNADEEIRIRQRGINGSYTYSKTKKITINGLKRIEIETRLTQEEYIKELQNADCNKSGIVKDRYCLSYKNQYFEIDIYPFWQDKAICEIELSSENQEVIFPEFLTVYEEVTDNENYKNKNLARILSKSSNFSTF